VVEVVFIAQAFFNFACTMRRPRTTYGNLMLRALQLRVGGRDVTGKEGKRGEKKRTRERKDLSSGTLLLYPPCPVPVHSPPTLPFVFTPLLIPPFFSFSFSSSSQGCNDIHLDKRRRLIPAAGGGGGGGEREGERRRITLPPRLYIPA
jgi:hypothetical protein